MLTLQLYENHLKMNNTPPLLSVLQEQLRLLRSALTENLMLSSSFAVVFFAVSTFLLYSNSKTYKTKSLFRIKEEVTGNAKMVIQNGNIMVTLVKELNNHIHLDDYEGLAKGMNISREFAEKMELFDAETPKLVQPESNNYLGDFWITIRCNDEFINTDSLQNALIYYFKTNPYLQDQFKLKSETYATLHKNTAKDRAKLDSLLNNLVKRPIAGLEGADMQGMSHGLLELYSAERSFIEAQHNNKIHVVIPFSKPRPIIGVVYLTLIPVITLLGLFIIPVCMVYIAPMLQSANKN